MPLNNTPESMGTGASPRNRRACGLWPRCSTHASRKPRSDIRTLLRWPSARETSSSRQFSTATSAKPWTCRATWSSWRHFASALKVLPRLQTQRQRFVTLQSAAAAATRGGLQEATLVFAEALLSVTRSWDNPEGQITGRLYRARALAELSRGDRGVADLDEASSRLSSFANRPQVRNRLAAEIAARRSFSLSGQNDAAALRAADEALAFFGTTLRIRIAELLLQRGRIHMRLGHNADATKDWLRGIEIVEDQRPSLRDEMLRVSRTASLWDLYTELLSQATSDGRRALELAERSHARELLFSLNPERDPQTLALADWQQALAGGRQAIVYAQLPSRLLVWRITATEVELTEQPVSADSCGGRSAGSSAVSTLVRPRLRRSPWRASSCREIWRTTARSR